MKRQVINKIRSRRQKRVRARARGTAGKPRLTVFRSAGHIYAQLIDDLAGKTLVAASSLEFIKPKTATKSKEAKTVMARKVGENLALKAQKLGLKAAVFDRGRYLFHGRIKALAEGAREKGLKI